MRTKPSMLTRPQQRGLLLLLAAFLVYVVFRLRG
jgi:hypothetical protein